MVEQWLEEPRVVSSILTRGTEMKKVYKKPKILVAVSGGFDPLHIGHVRLFGHAKELGDELVVILNNDNWLKKKKKHIFMPENERAAIIEALEVVDGVVLTDHKENPDDMSANSTLRKVKPDIFANGGDRKMDNIPEIKVCEEIGCEVVFGVGRDGKSQSSSWLLEDYLKKHK